MWNDICFCTREDCPRTDCRRHWSHHPVGEPFSYYEGRMCEGDFENCDHYWWGAFGGEDGRLDLNTATEEELYTLGGLGKTKIKGILLYREQHGGFKSVPELLKCHSMGLKTYEKIKDKVCVKSESYESLRQRVIKLEAENARLVEEKRQAEWLKDLDKANQIMGRFLDETYDGIWCNLRFEHVDEAAYWYTFELKQDSRRQTWCVRHSEVR